MRIWKTIYPIAAGFIIMTLAASITLSLLSFFYEDLLLGAAHAEKIFSGWFIMSLLFGLGYGLVGGYVTTALSRSSKATHIVLLILAVFFFGILSVFGQPEQVLYEFYIVFSLSNTLLSIVGILLGSYFLLSHKQRGARVVTFS